MSICFNLIGKNNHISTKKDSLILLGKRSFFFFLIGAKELYETIYTYVVIKIYY